MGTRLCVMPSGERTVVIREPIRHEVTAGPGAVGLEAQKPGSVFPVEASPGLARICVHSFSKVCFPPPPRTPPSIGMHINLLDISEDIDHPKTH